MVQLTRPNNGLHPVPFLTLSREINPFRTHHLHLCQPHSRSFLAPQELYYLYQSEEYDSSICSIPVLTPENHVCYIMCQHCNHPYSNICRHKCLFVSSVSSLLGGSTPSMMVGIIQHFRQPLTCPKKPKT